MRSEPLYINVISAAGKQRAEKRRELRVAGSRAHYGLRLLEHIKHGSLRTARGGTTGKHHSVLSGASGVAFLAITEHSGVYSAGAGQFQTKSSAIYI